MEKELEEFILNLTAEFGKTVPKKEEEREELITGFKTYMYNAVKTLQNSTSKFNDVSNTVGPVTLLFSSISYIIA